MFEARDNESESQLRFRDQKGSFAFECKKNLSFIFKGHRDEKDVWINNSIEYFFLKKCYFS